MTQPIGTLHPEPPYRFDLTLALLNRFPHPTVDIVHDNAYYRLLSISDTVRVNQGDNGALNVEHLASTGAYDPDTVVKQVAHILCADLDIKPFYAYAQTQPELWQIVEPLVGLRWLRMETAYEALMTTIIEQQIAWKTAQKAQRWLVEWANNTIIHDGRTYYAFPTPAQIANATIDDLTPLKITFRRMGVMIDISQQIASGALDIEAVLDMSEAEGYQLLVNLKGIGHWTAAWTLQRAHGLHNTVGHNDVALQAAVNHYFYGGEGRIPAQQVADTFARYGDYAGLAAHHTILRWVFDRY